MSAVTRKTAQTTDGSKLPKLIGGGKMTTTKLLSYPTGLPTKEELESRIGLSIQNDLIPRSLETFCDSTKDYLKDENQIKKSKLTQTEFGKYVFVNEHGISLNKYGPFWPKSHKIIHSIPKFISNRVSDKEYYTDKMSFNDLPSSSNFNTQYTADWRFSTIVYDSQKSSRIQEPIIFAQRFSPSLVFESRFESGNLRQARRVYA
jgi:hypothetical protein